MTPGEFHAMRYRLEVRFRHQCYLAGVVAADYRNAHRTADGQRVFSPLDYCSHEEMSESEVAAEEKEQNERAISSMVRGKAVKEVKSK